MALLVALGSPAAARADDAGESAASPPAAPAAADSLPAARAVPVGRGPGRVVPRLRKPSRFDAPKYVMFRSLLVPGWGQAHNHAWIKAVVVGGAETFLGMRLISDRQHLNRINAEVSQARAVGDADRELQLIDDYNSRLSGYQSRQWILGGLITYALLDAYIDAQFRGFRIEFEGDPALPGGKPPNLKLSLRGTF